jgi:hypothetical protein
MAQLAFTQQAFPPAGRQRAGETTSDLHQSTGVSQGDRNGKEK